MQGKSVWIVKPGENSNRGRGIEIFNNIKQIEEFISSQKGSKFVIQKYIDNPLLIEKRKFDIRVFGLA